MSKRIKINQEVIAECLQALSSGEGREGIIKRLHQCGLRKTQRNYWARKIIDKWEATSEAQVVAMAEGISKKEEREALDRMEFSQKYIYNAESKKYIFLLEKNIGKNLVLDEDRVKSILTCYSNHAGKPSTVNEIAVRFAIPRNFVIHILRALGYTHDSLPITDEDLISKKEEELVEEILQQKRFALNQKINKRDWDMTRADAAKWREFECGFLNPFQDYIQNFNIEGIKGLRIPNKKVRDQKLRSLGDTMVIGAFDWQIGSSADGRFLFFGEEWSTEKALDSIEVFTYKVRREAEKRGIKKAVIIFGGDIFHGFEGLTAKKTELKCDTFRSDQFDAAVKGVSTLIAGCVSSFKSVECKIVTGNHEGWTFYPVFRLVESLFSNNKTVTFDISNKEFIHFRVNNSMFVVHHGASADYKMKIPNDRKGRVALGQRVIRIAEREGGYEGVERIFFIKGDTHSFEAQDLGQFTFYTFGALPTGDEYADALALESTPCQNALVIGDGKDYETLHLTFG